jgi:hypothetical protein
MAMPGPTCPDDARLRAYRWGEDGLLGISDERCTLCFALALWNEADPILKERPFGLTNPRGNHGEGPQGILLLPGQHTHPLYEGAVQVSTAPFPYGQLVEVNGRLGQDQPEFELMDTGIFAENRYFDVMVEYAKAGPEDICIRLSATNRGPDTPSTCCPPSGSATPGPGDAMMPAPNSRSHRIEGGPARGTRDASLPGRTLAGVPGRPQLLFTENESNAQRLWNAPNHTPFVKDGIHEAVIHGNAGAVNPANIGTKVAAQYSYHIEPGTTERCISGSAPLSRRVSRSRGRRVYRPPGRGGRFLRGAAGRLGRCSTGPAPGPGRAALEQAVL